jgi:hypothetical protein
MVLVLVLEQSWQESHEAVEHDDEDELAEKIRIDGAAPTFTLPAWIIHPDFSPWSTTPKSA